MFVVSLTAVRMLVMNVLADLNGKMDLVSGGAKNFNKNIWREVLKISLNLV